MDSALRRRIKNCSMETAQTWLTNSAGRTKKTRPRSSEQRLSQEPFLWTRICYEETEFIVDSRASKIYNSEIKRIWYECYSEWINHYDRRCCSLRQRCGHFQFSSIIGRFARLYSRLEKYVKNMGIPRKGRKDTRPH